MTGADVGERQTAGPKFILIRLPPDPLTAALFLIPPSVFRPRARRAAASSGSPAVFAHEAQWQ